jgi:drug/metabolite transporter (DMT)-like permease
MIRMTRDVHHIQRPSIPSLVRGIIEDAKQLVLGQYELRKYQTEQKVVTAKTVATWMGVGLALAVIGLLLLILMVVHLLNALANIPLWGSYAIVGFVLLGLGGGFIYGGKKRLNPTDGVAR